MVDHHEHKETKKTLLLIVFSLGVMLTYIASLFLPLPYQKKGTLPKNQGETTMSHDMHTAPSYGNDAGMDTGEGMADAMNQMTSSLSAKEGDAFDKEFLKQMIVHHEGAVMMAKEALAKSKNKDILTLSTQIIEAQQAEIAEMKLWQKGKK